MKKILLILLLFLNISIINAEDTNLVNIYLFHSDTCSHCKEEIKLLNKLKEKYNNINIYMYEVSDKDNYELYNKVKEEYNLNNVGVPFTIVGGKYFIGYSDEMSKLNFIKTIIYYSNNGYRDEVAKIVGNNNLPTYKISDDITIEEFIKNYGNYKLLFFETDNLSIENSNLILSLLSELNIFNISLIILLVLLLLKISNNKTKLLIISIYILLYVMQNTFYLLNKNIINNILLLLTLNYFVYGLLYYIVKNKKNSLLYGIILLLSILSNYLKVNFSNNYLNIFKELLELNTITLFEYVIQIILNTISVLFITIIMVYIIYMIIRKITKKWKTFIRWRI